MNTLIRESKGQGILFSKLCNGVSGPFVITRLTSQSLTGRGLQIHVQQHFRLKLHLVWQFTRKNGVSSESCMERVFLMYEDVEKFCTELKGGALEELCDCVCEGVIQLLEEKFELCFRRPQLKSETDRSLSKS